MLERTDGHDVIARLAASNCFVIPLDDEHRWFRYHHLFQDLLIDRLDRSDPTRERRSARASRTLARRPRHDRRSPRLRTTIRRHAARWEVDAPDRGSGWRHGARWRRCSTGSADRPTTRSPPTRRTRSFAGWVHTLTGDPRRAEFFAAAAASHPLDAPAADGAASLASALANLRSALGTAGIEQMLVDGQFVYDSGAPDPYRVG